MNDFLLLLVQAAWKLKKSYQKVGKIAHDARQLQNHRKVVMRTFKFLGQSTGLLCLF